MVSGGGKPLGWLWMALVCVNAIFRGKQPLLYTVMSVFAFHMLVACLSLTTVAGSWIAGKDFLGLTDTDLAVSDTEQVFIHKCSTAMLPW